MGQDQDFSDPLSEQETTNKPNVAPPPTPIEYIRSEIGPGLGTVETAPVIHTKIKTFDSFKNPQFRLYWFGSMGQMAAMNMQMMTRTWYAYELSGSATMLGLIALSLALPMLIFSIYGGIIADRTQKRYILLAGQCASGILALGIAISITIGSITVTHLIVAGIIQGTIMGLMMPARQAIIPEIVGEQGLMNAISLNAAGMNVNRLIAPGLAGFLIGWLGIQGVYYTMAALYLIAICFIVALKPTFSTFAETKSNWEDLKEGVRYIRGNNTVLGLLWLTLIMVLLSVPFQFLLPIFTEDILHVGPEGLGMLFSMSGVGALVGSLIIASLGDANRGRLFLLSGLILAISLIAFSISTWYWVSLLIILPIGLGNAGRMAISNTLVQSYTDDIHRGRVMSIYMMEFGLMSLSTFAVSVISEFVGIQWSIGGAATILLIISIYYLKFVPSIRKLQ